MLRTPVSETAVHRKATLFFRYTKSGFPKRGCLLRQPVRPYSRNRAMSAGSVPLFPCRPMRDITSEGFAFEKTSAIAGDRGKVDAAKARGPGICRVRQAQPRSRRPAGQTRARRGTQPNDRFAPQGDGAFFPDGGPERSPSRLHHTGIAHLGFKVTAARRAPPPGEAH